MTERLRLPETLAGPYEHAVICTYGADLAFLEQDLWRKLGRARNRILLADDLQLAQALNDAAAAGTPLRHLNVNYVAAPVTNPNAAHAKLILLTGPEAGLLLVGSGNLGMNGYASQGELFCQYRYHSEDPSHLAAFHTTRELLEEMAARGYLNPTATSHLTRVWADAPWLYGSAPDGQRPVRHNLHVPLLDQLAAETAGGPVDEVVVHAPFYDRRCQALHRLLEEFSPKQVTVLVQQHETSVDANALTTVLAQHRAAVRTAAAPIEGTYLHAKFVLVRQRRRAVLLQGSPNLSVAALCRADPAGNLELANLLTGPPDAFDDVLEALVIGRAPTDPRTLGLRYHPDPQPAATAIRLTYGLWSGGQLTLEASCDLPPPDHIQLLVLGEPVAANQITVEGRRVQLRPDATGAAALERAVPVALRLTPDGEPVDTWPTWPYQQAALRLLLVGRRDPKLLATTGSLTVPDDEVTALLEELDAALMIDGTSLWRVAKRPTPASTDADDGPRTPYEGLDWERLRQHPKLAQYGTVSGRDTRLEPTDLQVVLTAITDHFRGLGTDRDPTAPDGIPDPAPGDAAPEGEEVSEQERIQQEQERERRRLSLAARNRMAWRRFVDRFLDGLADEKFIEVVGPVVVATNAVIFNHLLTLLVAKDQIDQADGVEAQLWLWEWLWLARGDDTPAFFDGLDPDEQTAARQVFVDRHADAMTVAAIYQAAVLSRHHGWEDERLRLRDLWRTLLTSPHLAITEEVLARAATQAAADPALLAATLDALTGHHTLNEVLAAVAAAIGAETSQLSLSRGRVQRRQRLHDVDLLTVGQMATPLTPTAATAAFAAWMAYQPERDYYRIVHPASGAVALYDRATGDRWWANKHTDESVDLEEITPAVAAWQAASAALVAATRAASSAA
jgi:hypothetical protein